MSVEIHYKPEIIKRGNTRHQRVEDGDTIFIEEGIRMLGIDTPEIHYPGSANPSKHDAPFADLSGRLDALGVSPALADHLRPRLLNQAGTRHSQQGEAATEALHQAMDDRLARYSNKTGKRLKDRELYIQVASEVFDHYGRMLAYVAPSYTRKERQDIPPTDRPTFNLQMLRLGWAAPIFIYPNIPYRDDLLLAQKAVRDARQAGLGAWADPHLLLGYELRSCVRLYKGDDDWITRYCIDMSDRRIYEPQDYHLVNPEDRIFVWARDVGRVLSEMNLRPAFDCIPTSVFT